MTAADHASERSSTGAARSTAVRHLIYAAGFGGPTVPVSIYLLRRHASLFFGLFDVYGGA